MMLTEERALRLQNKTLFISCIVPVYNEEAVIEAFISQLQAFLRGLSHHAEIIIVDDGSRDGTVAKILHLQQLGSTYDQVKLISLSRNFGKEIALTAGLEHCRGEVAILMDADFQHPIELIANFLQQWVNGYDMVYGTRLHRAAEAYHKRHLATFFYWLMRKITSIEIPNNAGDFRLMDRKVVDALRQFPERTRFMKGLYVWVGFSKIAIPFEVPQRLAGNSSWGITRLTELAITGITSFSDVPLRVWGFIGFIISLSALLYAIYIITVTMLYGADLPGFPTLIVAIMFLGGIQLLSIGILGEYIARIFTEVKQRPKYLVQMKVGFDE